MTVFRPRNGNATLPGPFNPHAEVPLVPAALVLGLPGNESAKDAVVP